jgi:hypothetical protein
MPENVPAEALLALYLLLVPICIFQVFFDE